VLLYEPSLCATSYARLQEIVNGLIHQVNGASHLVIACCGRFQEKWQVVNFLRS
jgi:hypothetical protein